MTTTASYIALCLFVPLAWGIASAYAFDWWQARRRERSAAAPQPAPEASAASGSSIEYYI